MVRAPSPSPIFRAVATVPAPELDFGFRAVAKVRALKGIPLSSRAIALSRWCERLREIDFPWALVSPRASRGTSGLGKFVSLELSRLRAVAMVRALKGIPLTPRAQISGSTSFSAGMLRDELRGRCGDDAGRDAGRMRDAVREGCGKVAGRDAGMMQDGMLQGCEKGGIRMLPP